MSEKDIRLKWRRCARLVFGTVGLWVSRPHDWSVLVPGPSFSYPHDIGDVRYAAMSWYLGIRPCFGYGIWEAIWYHFAFPEGHMLFALCSISILQSNTVCLSRPPTPVYTSSTPGLCKAWELVALGHNNMPVQASICIWPWCYCAQTTIYMFRIASWSSS